MNNKIYLQPETAVVAIASDGYLLGLSNEYNTTSNSVLLNSATMEGGDGSDAASRGRGSVWDDE